MAVFRKLFFFLNWDFIMHLEDHGWRICPAVDERIKIVVAYNNLLFIICFEEWVLAGHGNETRLTVRWQKDRLLIL